MQFFAVSETNNGVLLLNQDGDSASLVKPSKGEPVKIPSRAKRYSNLNYALKVVQKLNRKNHLGQDNWKTCSEVDIIMYMVFGRL